MNAEKSEQMFQMAKRITERCPINEPIFSLSAFEPEDDSFPRDLVAMVTEGRLRGQVFATWLPITKEAYEKHRDMMTARAKDMWRSHAISAILPMSLLMGTPKGKLPA